MNNVKLNEMIWQIVASIPKGKVAAYGQIAKLAGFPNHARYVGATLKNLPNNTKLPWHRVLSAKREISFPLDSEHYKIQRELLIAEGVLFKNNKVAKANFAWKL